VLVLVLVLVLVIVIVVGSRTKRSSQGAAASWLPAKAISATGRLPLDQIKSKSRIKSKIHRAFDYEHEALNP
jgi:hypothetical protein